MLSQRPGFLAFLETVFFVLLHRGAGVASLRKNQTSGFRFQGIIWVERCLLPANLGLGISLHLGDVGSCLGVAEERNPLTEVVCGPEQESHFKPTKLLRVLLASS